MVNADDTGYSEEDAAPRLLVPINVEALASVQSFMGSVANWSIVPMNYSQLANFESPEPQNLFNGQNLTIAGGNPWTGVILHWALPDALTHGTQATAASPPGSPPSSGGEITFPRVPNRWLVLRTSMDPNYPNDPQHRITRVWALQSDYVDLPGSASNSFSYDFTDNGQEYYIGRSWLLTDAPPAGSSPSSAELQAIGPGDATFAAYMANINNVFTFRDDLMLDFPQNNLSVPVAWIGQNPPRIGAGLPLTYMVAGWYSDPSQDPLYDWQALGDDGWEQVLASLGWSVEDATVKPSQILCHGSVYGVNWLGRTGEVQSGIPVQTRLPLVAVGNTSVEALAALLEQQINEQQAGRTSPAETGEQVAEILEAFQYNLLSLYDQPGGQAKINQQKYQAGFGSGQGGTLWDIIRPLPPEVSPPGPQSPPDTQPPVLTEQQSAWLAQLNSLQQDYDRLSRQLDSMQEELFSDWWKKIYTLFLGSSYYNRARAAYLQLKARVLAQQSALDRILSGAGGIEDVKQQLSDSLGDSLQLVSREAPRFWHPVDPVVLICGAKGSFKHGEDDLYTDDGTLFCRVSGQAIDSMLVTGGKSSATVTGADLVSTAQRSNPFPANAATNALMGPPPMADIIALFAETLLVDTTNAMMIAQAALPRFTPPDNSIPPATLAAAVVALQNSIWNFTLHDALNRQTPADHPFFNGMIPSKNSLEFWTPPWSPLYLDWQVEWLPSWSKMAAVLNGWQFDAPVSASDKQLDYQWVSPSPPDPNTDPYLQFQGRTLLTPKAADAFAARLEQFLEHVDPSISGYTPPESPYESPPFTYQASPPEDISIALGEVLNMISNWDILSQSLSGLHQQLIMRDPGQHVPLTSQSLTGLLNNVNQPLEPGETVQGLLDLFGGADKSLPLPQVPTSGPPRYNPIRAGHFVITKLWVVDDFGQVYNVFSNTEANPYLQPVISEALRTPAPGQTPPFLPGIVQMTPRFVQPSRLNFRFVSATDAGQETTSDPLTNPVCGWVLPNHLDKGLTIYDAGGNALGELVLAGGVSNRRLRWEPIPNTPAPVGAPPDISNEHLRGFVEGLLAQADGGKTFLDLLSVIDETLWTTDPLGERGDQSLSVLIGRPLALVRASLELELNGNPVYDQGWATTGQQVQTVPYPASQGQPNFTDIPITVHLGNLELRDDGLMGYFTDDNYQQFNTLRMPRESTPSSYFIQQDFTLKPDSDAVSPAGESRSVVTMLVDPRGYVYANTGILPIKQIALPGEYVEPALARMDVTFRTGPVLTDAETLRMPLPSFSRGNWSWIQHTGVTVWQEDTNIAKADPKPSLTDIPLSLREGWLKLSKPMADDE